jgi:hypothetical protein
MADVRSIEKILVLDFSIGPYQEHQKNHGSGFLEWPIPNSIKKILLFDFRNARQQNHQKNPSFKFQMTVEITSERSLFGSF